MAVLGDPIPFGEASLGHIPSLGNDSTDVRIRFARSFFQPLHKWTVSFIDHTVKPSSANSSSLTEQNTILQVVSLIVRSSDAGE